MEPKGENLTIWKSKQRMQEMFEKGRLCRGTVPPSKLQTESKLRNTSESKETVECQERKLPKENLLTSPGMKLERNLFPKSGKSHHELAEKFSEEKFYQKFRKWPKNR